MQGVHMWETKVASSMDRHREELHEQMKLAIFINMFQMSCGSKFEYCELRDCILGVANQKL